MKKIMNTPDVRVIRFENKDIIVTSDLRKGDDVGGGDKVVTDIQARQSIWD